MTQLFVQLAQSVTGNIVTIVALELVAATIGVIVAWFYAKSVYTPVIKGLEADKIALNKEVLLLKDELVGLDTKINKLREKIDNLEVEKTEKDKENAGKEKEIAEKEKELNDLSNNTRSMGRYVISKAKSGENYFNLKATNGQIILTSELYSSMTACTNGIESVRKNCVDDHRYERKLSSNNKPHFNLKASNGQIIGKSELYESEASMEKGIASVKRNGISTTIVEE